MDTFAHGLAGALIFSRSGYAGLFLGRNRPDVKPRHFDWTIPPFLYPLSNFTVGGVPFMRPSVFISYWSILLTAWVLLLWLKRREKLVSRKLQEQD